MKRQHEVHQKTFAAFGKVEEEEDNFDILTDVVAARCGVVVEPEHQKQEVKTQQSGDVLVPTLAHGYAYGCSSVSQDTEPRNQKEGKTDGAGGTNQLNKSIKEGSGAPRVALPSKQHGTAKIRNKKWGDPGAFSVSPTTKEFHTATTTLPQSIAPPSRQSSNETDIQTPPPPNHPQPGLQPCPPQPALQLTENVAIGQTLPGAVHCEGPSFRENSAATPMELSSSEGSPTPQMNDYGVGVALFDSGLAVANLVSNEPSPLELPQAQNFDERDESRRRKERKARQLQTCITSNVILVIAVIVVAVCVLVPVLSLRETDANDDGNIIMEPTNQDIPSQAPTPVEESILSLLPEETVQAITEESMSPQAEAFSWLVEDAENILQLPHRQIQQRFALATLYFATGGDMWISNDNWLNHSVDECDWFQQAEFGIKSIQGRRYPGWLSEFFPPTQPQPTTCDQNGTIQHLWLDRNHLVGSLPEELYLLTSLQTLSLGLNQFQGSISTRFGQLTQLEGLEILDQPPDGSIPSEIGILTSLRGLVLSDSNHQGPIPREIWQLTDLESLILLNHQQMEGSIPSEVGLFPMLRWLVLDNCNRSGSIPTEIGQISTIEWFVVTANVTGTLPTELGLLSNLHFLSLFRNSLVGSIPSELGQLTSLFFLTLRENALGGPVPSEMGLLQSLTWRFSLRGNQFSGNIPTELGLLTGLVDLHLQENRFTGKIPSELGGLSSAGMLRLGENSLSGHFPPELSNLQSSLYELTVQGNPLLSGTIPTSLCHLNGTCVRSGVASCDEHQGLVFDCTGVLCGCDCTCGAGNESSNLSMQP
ncbi:Leucine Rich Repeat [Seminavis robusta]|uniref:Leucine Rich Repeat n=1 Tax=Seminavis robusta TaxID=568900 RepID=A0A9N8DEL1_9STRA|nr:Leucine Rich Repeat [Seminavis robusta]|eukprot:Sro86_g045610.1 Leucine Rich Repeat (819) ;mRNA; r:24007-26557